MSKWKSPPNVVVLSGDDEYLRSRELKEAISIADMTGRMVETIYGGQRDELSRILSSSGVFFRDPILLIVEEPQHVDVDLVLKHQISKGSLVSIVLNHAGILPKSGNLAKIVGELPTRMVAAFKKPKPWEIEEYATKFCVKEASKRGLDLGTPLARALVQNVGQDLGVLSFEIEKISMFLGGGRVTPQDLSKVLGAFVDGGPKPVVEGLEVRSLKKVSAALWAVHRASAHSLPSAVLRVCAFVVPSVITWLHVASLASEGASGEEIGSRVGVHPYVVQKTLSPAAKRWGEKDLVQLVRGLAVVEKAVKLGKVNPWVQLECCLFRAVAGL